MDDEPLNRTLLRAILADHEVIEARDAAEALELVARQPVDLALLDVMMPGMDGFELCRELKRRFPEPYLPVLLITALTDQDSRIRGFEAGADDFLSKPFDRRELLLRTKAFLQLRHQDEHIRHQLADLRYLDRLKDDLAALLVHDLRNPLAGLSGLLWVLRREAPATAQQEILDDAIDVSQHLRDAIEDMLRIRLIEQKGLVITRAPVPVRKLVAEAVASLEGDARARGLAIETSVGDEVVDVDATLIRRSIENLLANALRYTRPRTTVSLSVHGEHDAVDILVADRGPGVPDALKREVFDKYASVDSEGPNPRRGNGLGLYLVKLATEAHGGYARVEDREDGGAVFVIHLPRATG